MIEERCEQGAQEWMWHHGWNCHSVEAPLRVIKNEQVIFDGRAKCTFNLVSYKSEVEIPHVHLPQFMITPPFINAVHLPRLPRIAIS